MSQIETLLESEEIENSTEAELAEKLRERDENISPLDAKTIAFRIKNNWKSSAC